MDFKKMFPVLHTKKRISNFFDVRQQNEASIGPALVRKEPRAHRRPNGNRSKPNGNRSATTQEPAGNRSGAVRQPFGERCLPASYSSTSC